MIASSAGRRASSNLLLSLSKAKEKSSCFISARKKFARRNLYSIHQTLSTSSTLPSMNNLRIKTFSSTAVPLNSININKTLEQRRHSILTHALQRVHDEGWTDDAIASGTLDAGLPPTYIGQAMSSTSIFGSADLVAFFMDECNNNLRKELNNSHSDDNDNKAAKIYHALKLRLSMTLPFVSSNRWHEGMAIGALPQNAYKTAQQLDEMATIVLEYALGEKKGSNNANAAQRAVIVAAYAAAELHLLSADVSNNGSAVASVSLSGERFQSTWMFLEERSNEAAKLIDDGVDGLSLSGAPFPNPTHVMAASAVVSSLAGAAVSLAAPTVAAMLPRAMEALGPLQTAIMNSTGASSNTKGTQPSDYQPIDTNNLPPFDSNEKIFSGSNIK